MNTAIAQGTRLFPAYRFLGEIDVAEGKFEAAVSSFDAALRVSESGDDKEAQGLQGQRDSLLRTIENLKQFAVLESEQKALDIVRPVLLKSATTRYTNEARSQKVQGTVSMAIRVNETGDVDSVLLLRGLGHGLDEQAEETVRKLKFSPATTNGKPIPHWIQLRMDFMLR